MKVIQTPWTPMALPQQTSQPFGRRCCCFTVILLVLKALVLAIVVILLVVGTKQPVFHVHSLRFDPFKLDFNTSKNLNSSSSSSSTAYLLFQTENPNKFGIRYNSSGLAVLYGRDLVGVIVVPMFYQPPRSRNVSISMQFSFEPSGISEIINGIGVSVCDTDRELRVFGDILVQAHVLNFPLPFIKVYLDCRMGLQYERIGTNKGVDHLRQHKALILSNFPQLSQKCSLALCI